MANQIDNDSKILGARPEGSGIPAILRVSGGRIYVTHINDSGELEVHHSDTNGDSWTLDETFVEASDIDMPSMIAYADGDIALSYAFNTGAGVYDIKVKLRDEGTGTWSEIKSVGSALNSTSFVKPILTLNKNVTNRLHLHYIQNNGTSVQLKGSSTDNKGGTFGGPYVVTTLEPSGGGGYNYFIANSDSEASTGDVYFFTVNYGNSTMAHHIINAAGTYQSSLNLSVIGEPGFSAAAIDSSNNKWYLHEEAGSIYVHKAVGAGAYASSLWIPTVPVLDGSSALGIDGNDNVYIFYTKVSDSKAYMRKYSSSGASWGSEIALTLATDGIRPACEQHTLAGSDKIHYVFYSN